MTTTENVTVYGCGFCKKKLFRKHAMVKHEEFCTRNPKNFAMCSGCKFLREEMVEISTGSDYNGEENFIKSKGFHCSKLDKDLYPMKVVRSGFLQRHPEHFEGQELMPNKCDSFVLYGMSDII